MEILQYILGDIWHFLGVLVLIMFVDGVICDIIRSLKGK